MIMYFNFESFRDELNEVYEKEADLLRKALEKSDNGVFDRRYIRQRNKFRTVVADLSKFVGKFYDYGLITWDEFVGEMPDFAQMQEGTEDACRDAYINRVGEHEYDVQYWMYRNHITREEAENLVAEIEAE
jgi:hypothetical protein